MIVFFFNEDVPNTELDLIEKDLKALQSMKQRDEDQRRCLDSKARPRVDFIVGIVVDLRVVRGWNQVEMRVDEETSCDGGHDSADETDTTEAKKRYADAYKDTSLMITFPQTRRARTARPDGVDDKDIGHTRRVSEMASSFTWKRWPAYGGGCATIGRGIVAARRCCRVRPAFSSSPDSVDAERSIKVNPDPISKFAPPIHRFRLYNLVLFLFFFFYFFVRFEEGEEAARAPPEEKETR